MRLYAGFPKRIAIRAFFEKSFADGCFVCIIISKHLLNQMKTNVTIILPALMAPSVLAAPLPEKAEKLAENTFVATYLDTNEQPCRHMTADCPNHCDHATRVARFHIQTIESSERFNQYGDAKPKVGSIFVVDVKNPTPGQDDDAFFRLVSSLKSGDKVRLTQTHYYGRVGNCHMPFRPITAAVRIQNQNKPQVPAIPAAKPGVYPVMPIAE